MSEPEDDLEKILEIMFAIDRYELNELKLTGFLYDFFSSLFKSSHIINVDFWHQEALWINDKSNIWKVDFLVIILLLFPSFFHSRYKIWLKAHF